MYNHSYALSNNFKEIISVMGIEKYNNQGYEINEYIYYTYNQIVYGSPEDAINEPTQRWKNVSTGKWIHNGQKGEYRLLGYNNIGKVVNNHDFPMDIIPSTEPTQWRYVTLPDALESWNDISRYKFVEQREYMKNVNLMRNNVTYNINANTIGLDKARLDNCSTWKTKGLIYTNREDAYKKKWEATFVAPEIGHNISFTNSVSTASKDYAIHKYVTSVDIEVNYMAKVEVNDEIPYIKPEHVKKLETSIYINGYLLGTITTSKKLSHKGTKTFTIYHEDLLLGNNEATIDIRSKLYTEFTTDGPLYASNSNTVNIYVDRYLPANFVDREVLNEEEYTEPEFEMPEDNSDVELDNISSANVEVIKKVKKNNQYYAQELNVAKTSNGFISAGNMIGIKVKTNPNVFLVKMTLQGDESIKKFDNKTKQFEWDEPRRIGQNTTYSSLEEYIELYNSSEYTLQYLENGIYMIEYLIPYETKQTLHSWNTIRNMTGQSLNIDKRLLLSRISEPYKLKFEIYEQLEEETENGTNIYTNVTTQYYYLDVFECWTSLYNRDITPYILNNNKNEVEYDVWKYN